MEKLTRKQVREHVQDPANWEIIPGNDYVRAARMVYGSKTYIRVDNAQIINYANAFVWKKEEPEIGFRTLMYYRWNPAEGDCNSISFTQLCDEIYQTSVAFGG